MSKTAPVSPFLVERRRLVAGLVLWAVVPLAFVGIILPPFWLVAGLVAGFVLVRARRGVPRLGVGAQNVLGVIIIVTVAAAGGLEVGPLRPLGHLLLLLTAVRLLTVVDRRTFYRALAPAALTWVMAVAASTHPLLAVYLLLSVALFWSGGMRVLLLERAQEIGASRPAGWPGAGGVAAATAAVAMIAVPLFVIMPRLQSPFVSGGGSGSRHVAGFSDAVRLGEVGSIRSSREVALTVSAPDGGRDLGGGLRLRGTVFDLLAAGNWAARSSELELLPERSGAAWLTSRRLSLADRDEVTIELVKPSRYVFLPEETVALRTRPTVYLDPGGGVVASPTPERPYTVTAWLGSAGARRFAQPVERDLFLPEEEPQVAALAARVAGDAPSAEAAASAIESFLRQSYAYTDQPGTPVSITDPVAWFLLEHKAGHCEYFAGGMVVLLRHLGIPARMVGGYVGGMYDDRANQLYVQEGNAHTWVEVWLGDDRGWHTYDPTPAGGIPGMSSLSGIEKVRWLWTRMESLWDRYVLTFGLADQVEILNRSVAAVVGRMLGWRRSAGVATIAGAGALVLLLAAALAAAAWRRRSGRGRGPASLALRRLERRLLVAGISVPRTATPRWLAAAAAGQWPQHAVAVRDLAHIAEVELYAARQLTAAEGEQLARLTDAVRRLPRR